MLILKQNVSKAWVFLDQIRDGDSFKPHANTQIKCCENTRFTFKQNFSLLDKLSSIKEKFKTFWKENVFEIRFIALWKCLSVSMFVQLFWNKIKPFSFCETNMNLSFYIFERKDSKFAASCRCMPLTTKPNVRLFNFNYC